MNGDAHVPPSSRPDGFHRRPTNLSQKAAKKSQTNDADQSGHIDLEGGLDIALNCEVSQKDPAGITVPYRLLVPALFYEGEGDLNTVKLKTGTWLSRTLTNRRRTATAPVMKQADGGWDDQGSSGSEGPSTRRNSEQLDSPQSGPSGLGAGYSGVEAYKEKGFRKWF